MNQGSFISYKNQVYNPGSPNPNPRTSPLRALPKDPKSPSPYLSTPNPDNPLRITFSAKRKREKELKSPESPKKKQKMATKEEIENVTASLLGYCGD